MKRILVLAPHPDDAELGCGATIARKLSEGTEVFVVALSNGVVSLPDGMSPDAIQLEFFASKEILGISRHNAQMWDYPARRFSEHRQEILEDLVRLRDDVKPDTVFIPSRHDNHQDHETVFQEGARAFRHGSLLGYELPWNTKTFDAESFCEVVPEHMEKKIAAVQAYSSQVILDRLYMRREYLQSWAAYRGLQMRVPLAEAFEVERQLW